MKLHELVPKEAIVENLKARDKNAAIRELVETIKTGRKPPGFKVNDILEAILKRERIGSTGMGGGVAVPHAKVEGVPFLMAAFGRSVEGIDFSAVDGEKVHLVFLLVSPFEEASAHLQALKRISLAIHAPNIIKFLKAARSAKDIAEIFREVDEQSVTAG